MTIRKNILSAAAISAFALSGGLGGALAAEAGGIQIMKPIQGITFDAGRKHGVGYFYAEAGRCQLVLTLADQPTWDDRNSFTVVRHESGVPAGQFTRYTSDGHSFEFGCETNAQTMTFRALSAVATAE